jgi:YVTN family beta-propeller protein
MSQAFPSLLAVAVAGALLASTPSIAHAGPKAYVGNFADNTVSVIDTSARTVVATIPVAAGPHGMAIAADGGKVYIAGDGSSSLDIIDTTSDRIAKTVEIGKTPNGVALTLGGRMLLVAVSGEDEIAFLATATEAVIGTVPLAKLSPDGKLAYVTSQQPAKFGLAVIDVPSRGLVRTVPLDKTPRDGELTPDGKDFYFTEADVPAVQVLDAASDKIVAAIPTASRAITSTSSPISHPASSWCKGRASSCCSIPPPTRSPAASPSASSRIGRHSPAMA